MMTVYSACEHEGLLEREAVERDDADGAYGETSENGTFLSENGDLDIAFARLYAYFGAKGYTCAVTTRAANLCTLGFTIWLSGFLLLYVDFDFLRTTCAQDAERCDILRDAVFSRPYQYGGFVRNAVVTMYLLLFSAYWVWSATRLAHDVAPLAATRKFCHQKLALSDRDMYTITWPEVLQRVVHLQATTRLSIARDLSEHDIVARILRKENYLVGMVNRDVLGLTLDVPGLRRHRWFTKVIEWNIDLAVFHGMFDENFNVVPSFYDASALRHRFRCLAVINAILSPFVAIFLSMYFVLSHAEKFYNTPSTVGTRDWSSYAYWRMREFNELPHFTQQRLAAAYPHAKDYVAQFPSPVVNVLAKFVSYVVGAFAACALFCAIIDDRLLQAYVGDRDLLWVTAVLGTILASSRALMATENAVFQPNAIMSKIVAHTHYLPKHWRDSAHKEEVVHEFNAFFTPKAILFLEEIASVFAAPFVLWFPLSDSVGDIIQFVRQFTVNKSGVGDICSMSAFDFIRHGNKHYGAPSHANKDQRSRQGKMEKSFLTFQATYPNWEPDASGRDVLISLNGFANANETALGKSAEMSSSVLRKSTRFAEPVQKESGSHHRFSGRSAVLRQNAHGSGSMFQPSFMSDFREEHTFAEALSASQTVLQHFYEEQAVLLNRDVDTAAENSPTRDDPDDDKESNVPTIDTIQMYHRPSNVNAVPMRSFPLDATTANVVHAQNGPSVLDSVLLPNSFALPPVDDDERVSL